MVETSNGGRHRRLQVSHDEQDPSYARVTSATNRPLSTALADALCDPSAWGVYLLAFVSTFAAVLPQTAGDVLAVDFAAHTALIPTWRDVAYPGWHVCAYALSKLLSCSDQNAAALASALFAVLAAIAIRWMGSLLLPDADRGALNLFTVVLMFVGPLYFPSFKETYIVGTGTPNTWHNPTNNAVKPFALICLVLYGYLAEARNREDGKRHIGTWLLFSALLLISTLCKPSFLQVFLPAVATYVICSVVATRGESLRFGIASFFACLPALVPFVLQYLTYFGGGDGSSGGAVIEPFVVWHTYTPSIVYSIACALALPLLVAVVRIGKLSKDPIFLLALLTVVFGVLEYIVFAESGASKLHGNFGWGWLIACTLLWCIAGFRFLEMALGWKHAGVLMKAFVVIGCVLLACHFGLGLAYYLRVVAVAVLYGKMAL